MDEDLPLLIETSTDDEEDTGDHPDLILFSSQSENDDTISERTHSAIRQDESQVEETSSSVQYNTHEDNNEQENYEYSDGQNEVKSLSDDNAAQHAPLDEAVIIRDVDGTPPDLVEPDDAGNEVPAPYQTLRAPRAAPQVLLLLYLACLQYISYPWAVFYHWRGAAVVFRTHDDQTLVCLPLQPDFP